MNGIAFIGAGRLAASLASELVRAGEPVRWIASRSREAAQRLAGSLRGAAAVDPAEAAQADLVFLSVPDDAIGAVAAALPWRAGQSVVHCSGATEVAVLEPAARAGAAIGGFHPLQIFSDPARAAELLAGSSVAVEAPPALDAELRRLAGVLGLRVLVLPPGARACYHGAASFAASCLLSMLDEAAAVWRSFGIHEADALRALLPLARGTLDAAERRGLAGALAGPVSRGDAGVVARHLDALGALGVEHREFYLEFARRQLRLAQASGRLDAAQLARLYALIERG